MRANRRGVLRTLGAATLGGLAGCVGDGSFLPRWLSGNGVVPEWDDPARTAKLVPDDKDALDGSGASVSLSQDGTTALAGARYDEDPNGDRAGSTYVFTRSDGSWRQQAKLVPEDGNEDDLFGFSVALAADGTTALTGAIGDEGPEGRQAGSAYVFSRVEESWSQEAKLAPDGVGWLDSFGESVALSRDGTTALVGAPRDENPNGNRTGSAYVFSRADGKWRQRTRLVADDGARQDDFGSSTAISADGTTVLVGAPSDENPNGEGAGSAYAFSRVDGSWSQQAKLVADDGDESDRFGNSVALAAAGTTVLVGAWSDENPTGELAGSAYAFSQVDGKWRQEAKLVPDDGDSRDVFGDSVALAGNGATAIVGASTDEDPNGRKAGSAYVFSGADGAWSQAAKIAPEDGDEGDRFGASVDLAADGRTALVGSHRDDVGKGEGVGSAYVYQA